MTDDTTVRPRHGTTYRDLPMSPPIGDTPPAAPSPPVAPTPPAGSDPGKRRSWPWLAAVVLVVAGIAAILIWSPWTDETDAVAGSGSLFRSNDGVVEQDSDDVVPSPFPEDFNQEFGGADDFFGQFDSPQDFLDQLDQFNLEDFNLEDFQNLIPPDLLEEFGLPEDFLDQLQNGDLGGLLDQLPEGLTDRLESFEGFGSFGDGFRFSFGNDGFGLDYLPDDYEVTSVRTESSGLLSPATEATIVAQGPEGDIIVTLFAGEATSRFKVPSGSEAVDMAGADAFVLTTRNTQTLAWSTDDGELAGTIEATADIPLNELVRIARNARQP